MKLVIAFLACLLCAQQPASFEGSVVNANTREPIRKATVVLHSRNLKTGTNYAAETDANGKFSFHNVEPGSYTLTAERQGFSPEVTGAPGAAPKPTVLNAGDSVKDFTVRLVPQCVITGRIVDSDGDPVRGAIVQAETYTYAAGKRMLRATASVNTNNQGEYRLFGLTPGTHYVKATTTGSRMRIGMVAQPLGDEYSATYFPGVIDPSQAAPLKLAAGSEFRNIDITLRKERVHSVSCNLPSDANTGGGYVVGLQPRNQLDRRPMSQSRRGNVFSFPGVPDGSYILTGFRSEGQQVSYAMQAVEVAGADVTGIDLSFQPAKQVRGSVRFEGNPPPAKFESIRVSLNPDVPLGNFRGTVPVKADGTFLFEAAPPVELEVEVARVNGAYLKSVQLADKVLTTRRFDLSRTDGPLTIIMGTDMGEVEGTAKLASGQPAPLVRITVIAYGPNLGRNELQRFGFTDDEGAFHIKDVAPGEYKVFAWEDVQIGAPQDADYRKPFENSGVPIKLESNGHASVSLTAIKTQTGQ